MTPRKYAISEFDVQGFVAAIGDFWLRVARFRKLSELIAFCDDSTYCYDRWDGPNDIMGELVRGGTRLFLPFHEPMCGQEVKCADGEAIPKGYKVPFLRTHGYTIQLDGEQCEIRLAITDIEPQGDRPVITYDDCGVYSERMEKFIDRFVRK